VTVPTDPVWDCGGRLRPARARRRGAVDQGGGRRRRRGGRGVGGGDDAGFTTVVGAGTATAGPDTDGCVKVLATGLAPANHPLVPVPGGRLTSPVGRTRTPAADGAAVGRVRLGVASCQNFPAGFYPAWRAMAAEDLDAVVHVVTTSTSRARVQPASTSGPTPWAPPPHWPGTGPSTGCTAPTPTSAPPTRPMRSCRCGTTRVRQRLRPADDRGAARPCRSGLPGLVRVPAGVADRRDPDPPRARFGSLVDLALLDTRQYRDPTPTAARAPSACPPRSPPGRSTGRAATILGDAQRGVLLDGFSDAQDRGITWKLVGNQVMIAPVRVLDLDEPFFRAAQPGHAPPRRRLHQHRRLGRLPVSGTGSWSTSTRWHRQRGVPHRDIHSFWQAPLRLDYDQEFSPAVAQEFVCGSVSSRGLDLAGDLAVGLGDAAHPPAARGSGTWTWSGAGSGSSTAPRPRPR